MYQAAAPIPIVCASEVFEDQTGQKVSDPFIHDVFEAVGAQACLEAVMPGPDEIRKRIDQVTTGKWRPILVVAFDAAHLLNSSVLV